MEVNGFVIRGYGWKELAVLYAPEMSPGAASKRLTRWVREADRLRLTLVSHGWKERKKQLTPMQVEDIVRYFGEP